MTTLAKILPPRSQAALPAHDPVPAARRFPHLYLVGEAERSIQVPAAPANRISIRINGQWHALRGRTATFSQLLRLAFPTRPLTTPEAATVSYRGGVASCPFGLLTPGDVIPLVDGLVVNADATYAS